MSKQRLSRALLIDQESTFAVRQSLTPPYCEFFFDPKNGPSMTYHGKTYHLICIRGCGFRVIYVAKHFISSHPYHLAIEWPFNFLSHLLPDMKPRYQILPHRMLALDMSYIFRGPNHRAVLCIYVYRFTQLYSVRTSPSKRDLSPENINAIDASFNSILLHNKPSPHLGQRATVSVLVYFFPIDETPLQQSVTAYLHSLIQ